MERKWKILLMFLVVDMVFVTIVAIQYLGNFPRWNDTMDKYEHALNSWQAIEDSLARVDSLAAITHSSFFQMEKGWLDKIASMDVPGVFALIPAVALFIFWKYSNKKDERHEKALQELNKQHNADLMAVMPLIQSVRDSLAIILQRLP